MAYYPKDLIKEIKQIDLLTYLQNYEPGELVKISEHIYSIREHDSLKISNGLWFWWSKGIGGRSALDFLVKVRGMNFTDAVEVLMNKKAAQNPIHSKPLTVPKASKLILPERVKDNSHLTLYLHRDRGIDEEIIAYCIQNGLIYEGIYRNKQTGQVFRNAVFVGYNLSGQAKYAAYRSLNASRIMGDCSGSSKAYSFRLVGRDIQTIHLFECAIDALSYATLLKLQNKNWQDHTLLSLSGVYQPKEQIENSKVPIALAKFLQEHPQTNTIYLHLDNDTAGRKAAKALKIILPKEIKVIDRPVPFGKDVNDFLLIQQGAKCPFQYKRRADDDSVKQSLSLVR